MEAISEEFRIASSVGGQNSNIKFTVIYPYMVDTGLCKNPKIKYKLFRIKAKSSQCSLNFFFSNIGFQAL